MSEMRYWFVAVMMVGVALGAGCAPVSPAKPDGFYIEAEPPPRVHRPKPTDTAKPTGAPAPTDAAAEAAPPATNIQLVPAAQSPTELPPPAGTPHDPSQYIEPPSR